MSKYKPSEDKTIIGLCSCFSKEDWIDYAILDYIVAMYDFLGKKDYNVTYKKHAIRLLTVMEKIRLRLNKKKIQQENGRFFGFSFKKFHNELELMFNKERSVEVSVEIEFY